MLEACLVFGSQLSCRSTDLKGADSLTLLYLEYLADRGYPFAHADVWTWKGEYLAIIERGRFYVMENPKVSGDVSSIFLRWFLKGINGKAFKLSYFRRMGKLASFYGVSAEVLRREDDVVLRFEGKGGRVGGEVVGGRGIKGGLYVEGENLFSSGVLFKLSASFDSLDLFLSTSFDVPPLFALALRGRGDVQRARDTLYYTALITPYIWVYPMSIGLGAGYSEVSFIVGRVSSVEPSYDIMLFSSPHSLGYSLDFSYVWVSIFAFKGIGKWKERVGGMDRFRKFPPYGHLSDNFTVLKLDAHLLHFGRLKLGPFADALFERGEKPLYAYGLSLKFAKEFSMFVTLDGYVGLAASVPLE